MSFSQKWDVVFSRRLSFTDWKRISDLHSTAVVLFWLFSLFKTIVKLFKLCCSPPVLYNRCILLCIIRSKVLRRRGWRFTTVLSPHWEAQHCCQLLHFSINWLKFNLITNFVVNCISRWSFVYFLTHTLIAHFFYVWELVIFIHKLLFFMALNLV